MINLINRIQRATDGFIGDLLGALSIFAILIVGLWAAHLFG